MNQTELLKIAKECRDVASELREAALQKSATVSLQRVGEPASVPGKVASEMDAFDKYLLS